MSASSKSSDGLYKMSGEAVVQGTIIKYTREQHMFFDRGTEKNSIKKIVHCLLCPSSEGYLMSQRLPQWPNPCKSKRCLNYCLTTKLNTSWHGFNDGRDISRAWNNNLVINQQEMFVQHHPPPSCNVKKGVIHLIIQLISTEQIVPPPQFSPLLNLLKAVRSDSLIFLKWINAYIFKTNCKSYTLSINYTNNLNRTKNYPR
jgi:hypothetical protein